MRKHKLAGVACWICRAVEIPVLYSEGQRSDSHFEDDPPVFTCPIQVPRRMCGIKLKYIATSRLNKLNSHHSHCFVQCSFVSMSVTKASLQTSKQEYPQDL
jgi:hypothetical protein